MHDLLSILLSGTLRKHFSFHPLTVKSMTSTSKLNYDDCIRQFLLSTQFFPIVIFSRNDFGVQFYPPPPPDDDRELF